MWTFLGFGFLIGLRHALEADHVAAVASLLTRSRGTGQALRLGLSWGLGHTLTLFAVGLVVLSVDGIVPEGFARGLEALVGVMLILLGGDVVRRMIRDRVHFHMHRHGEVAHFHAHSHAGEGRHRESVHSHSHESLISKRSLFVGLIHGLAGSAALVLLTLESMESLAQGLLYIALFGIGSLVGMGILSCVISLPLRFAARNLTWAYNGISLALGLFTIGLGTLLVVENLV